MNSITMQESVSDFFDDEFIEEIITKNEYYEIRSENAISLIKGHFWEKGERYKFLDIYLDDLYSENYSLQYDIDINNVIKKYKDIDILFIESFAHQMPTSVKHLFNNLSHIRTLSIQGYLKQKECRNLESFYHLEVLRLRMWNARDIDFTKCKNLKRCMIIMSKHNSTKDQIQVSREYIKKLESDGSDINFELIID